MPEVSATILIVDDEPQIVDILELSLGRAGFTTRVATDGAGAVDGARRGDVDLVILDIGLPGIDGMEACRQIREFSDVRILMLTARDEDRDILRGLKTGADDYVVKPFKLDELLARVRALLRRSSNRIVPNMLEIAELKLDLDSHEVRRAGLKINLTATEFRILALFMRNPRRVLTKEMLLGHVDSESLDANIVEVYVGRIRRKLGEPPLLHTVRGAGYLLKPDA